MLLKERAQVVQPYLYCAGPGGVCNIIEHEAHKHEKHVKNRVSGGMPPKKF